MTVFDIFVIGLLLLSTGLAVARGAVLELATLIALGLAFLLTLQFAGPIVSATGNDGSTIGTAVVYVIMIGILFVLLYAVSHFLLHKYPFTGRATQINRAIGGLFGFLRGYVLIGLGFLAYGYYLDEANQHESVRNAFTRPLAASGAKFFERFIPDSARLNDPANVSDGADAPAIDASSEGYGRADRAGLAEVITTVTTAEDPGSASAETAGSFGDDQPAPEPRY